MQRTDQPLRTHFLDDEHEGKLLLMFGWEVENESDDIRQGVTRWYYVVISEFTSCRGSKERLMLLLGTLAILLPLRNITIITSISDVNARFKTMSTIMGVQRLRRRARPEYQW